MRQPNSSGNTSIKAERIFLLSPANIGGIRGSGLMSGLVQSDLATRLQTKGATLGEIFSFISGLYFRGKLVYSQTFAKVTDGRRSGHATYIFTKPRNMDSFLTLYTKAVKSDIRRNHENVAERLGFLGRVVHGTNPRLWLRNIRQNVCGKVPFAA